MREYSTREVAEVSGVLAPQIRRWARAGLVTPHKDTSGHWQFSFQDLALLRMAGRLLDADVSLNRVTRTLRQLREQLPSRPLSSVRLVVVGSRVIVRDRMASWALDSRQGVFGFEMDAVADQLDLAKALRDEIAESQPEQETLYEAALDLELAGRTPDAERAYVALLNKDPSNVDAQINLGRLLHDAGRLEEAEACYRAALAREPDNTIATFNLGVVLEDRHQTKAAIAEYRRAIELDDAHADAHFNLSRLLEADGDARAALRHLSQFRRLTRAD